MSLTAEEYLHFQAWCDHLYAGEVDEVIKALGPLYDAAEAKRLYESYRNL